MPLKIKPNAKDKAESLNNESGQSCGVIHEPWNEVRYNKAPCETIVAKQNNAWIVLGRDRPGDLDSGYGGKGHGNDSCIDIVVGRLSSLDARVLKGRPVNPNPFADAARLYLSQKTDLDSNYNLVEGMTGKNVGRSGAILKADDVRLVARNTLKLMTNTDAMCSSGDMADTTIGVQLIANNDDSDMQPMVKGDYVVSALNELVEKIMDLNGIVKGFMEIQKTFNQALTSHTHISPFFAMPTSPSPELIPAGKSADIGLTLKVETGLPAHVANMYAFRGEYLLSTGEKYISSAYHYLN